MEIPARSMIGDIHGIVGALPPGWKKIGKKLRDIVLPPSDNGPSKEERQMIRLADVSKGFAYFDEFDELEEWTPESVDPIQRANVPLLPRAAAVAHGIPKSKSKVLLCHDYKGGYQDYEAIRPPLIDEEMYSCEYLQFVDTFVYFSHKLASLPPPTWTNAMHRNGVKVLGTFILEPQSEDPERMFRKKDGKFVIPTVLSTMAETFGFDGWLLNFEREFPSNSTNQLLDFIRELKRGLGEEKIVIWYDSLTVENKLHYQNALTINNLIFAQETDGFFTNYRWSEKGLAHSQKLALENGISTGKIFFGIDVWAQNTDMPGPPRVTWPAQGGGGTNTGYVRKT